MTFDINAFRREVLNDALVRDIWDSKYRYHGHDGHSPGMDGKLRKAQPAEESVDETRTRVVRAVYHQDLDLNAYDEALFAVQNGYLIPAGRVNAGAGIDRTVTLMNCFVNETVMDSMTGIQRAVTRAALTMQQGGGIGTDWSTVRPNGAVVKRTGSVSSGCIPFMDEMSAMCETISSAGTRRGAMMGTLRDDHPDLWNPGQFETTTTINGTVILKNPSFISAKRQKNRLTQFNVSILISDAFMQAIENDSNWDLGFHVPRADGNHVAVYQKPFPYDAIHYDNEGNAEEMRDLRKNRLAPWYVYTRVKARTIWRDIMESTYKYAEPGVIFIDRINARNNLNYCEEIRCTNPCGEQPLPPHGTCCLSSVNTAFMVNDPFTPRAKFNWSVFNKTVRVGIRFLDNVLTVSKFPLQSQQDESDSKRRIGLGITGWGSALAQLGMIYGSDESVQFTESVSLCLARESYNASAFLARERGAFQFCDIHKLLDSPNVKQLGNDVQINVGKYGLRNGVLNTVAPNGTISMYIGNVSSGIEPIFSTAVAKRKVRQPDGSFQEYASMDYAVRLWDAMHPDLPLPKTMVGALDVHPLDHLRIQAAWQHYIDASISKTINCATDLPIGEFMDIYQKAYDNGCKGCTTYRYDPDAGRGSVLSVEPNETVELPITPTILFQTTADTVQDAMEKVYRMEAPTVLDRPDAVDGRTYKIKWPPTGENVYVTITHTFDNRPLEVFIKHTNADKMEWVDALSRMITGIMRRGGDVRFIVEQLEQVGGTFGGAFIDGQHRGSHVAAIAHVISKEFRRLGVHGEEVKQQEHDVEVSRARTAPETSEVTKVEIRPVKAFESPVATMDRCPNCRMLTYVRETGCKRCLTCGHEECG